MKKYLRIIFFVIVVLLGLFDSGFCEVEIKGKVWRPLSRVYLNFGNLAIDNQMLKWQSGQESTYKIFKEEQRFIVIELISRPLPKFHDVEYEFIKFMQVAQKEKFWSEQTEVTFYENKEDFKRDGNMWGVYVIE
ncbi:MAG: hypothetical protein GY853_05955 [PVC group bacterium]|nr:hypothetical protein [PVC group bacterium]